ncbi:mitochondrial phosphatidylserine decarboxylase domain protein [Andalucia godoyi]|uniref:phosphatidylserine decarboxylase n=1 Tax=Andalucia godoyi TaxID=505711 RepID=A0A8K0AHT4_ANDGO|nr:mitochondrial phosphatidylserine decarboxylase domain protein [Andalucia godoyi]|eukprot:ANDGO_00077.mRNA.1 mitochondrial phosphatidylserine decarboxylase domain protein
MGALRRVLKYTLGAGAVAVGGTAAFLQYSHMQMGKPGSEFKAGDWTIFVPTRGLSRAWGTFTNTELPELIRVPFLKTYAWMFNCKLNESERPIESYPTLAKFFTRNLVDGARPIDTKAPLVSPADSKIMALGQCDTTEEESNLLVEQVKGVTYSVKSVLARKTPVPISPQKRLYYAVFYLAPGDYHGFHSPSDVTFSERIHVFGQLLPVWTAFVRNIPGLFALNERVVLQGRWDHGYMGYIAVGATNVGSIRINFDPDLRTNVLSHEVQRQMKDVGVKGADEIDVVDVSSLPMVKCKKGENVGFFHLGSTIVLLFEAPKDFVWTVNAGDTVKYGQAIMAKRT